MTFHVGSRLENTSLLSFFDFNILKHEGNFRQQEIVRVGYLQLENIKHISSKLYILYKFLMV